MDDYVANRLEFVNGDATGRVLPPVMASATKAQWIREYAKRENINLSDSYAYSDSISDLEFSHFLSYFNHFHNDLVSVFIQSTTVLASYYKIS